MKPSKTANAIGDMPRFYFHLINDMDVPDGEGKELPDLEGAGQEAARQARMLMGQMLKDEARIDLSHRIDIEDEHGAVLATVSFKDVVTVSGSSEASPTRHPA